jgi:methylated-DNA-protein-cysteine methyltransferase-like protein
VTAYPDDDPGMAGSRDGGAAPPNLTERICGVVASIPEGMVTSYGIVAALAGNPRGARQVVRTLNTQSSKRGLPWHRVINSQGKISLPAGGPAETQQRLLESEGVEFDPYGRVDFEVFGWPPRNKELPGL